ncbi:MAG TPA: ABC transporter permease [Gammaproteobacteria bacterium]|nr:ABC transporter permease [Gammaproteobacteria bacterium]
MSEATGIQYLWGYRDLVRNLVAKEIKVKYMGAWLGFAWSLANPLVVSLMYLVVFTYVFPSRQPHFPLYMVTGIIHWFLFGDVAVQSPEILVQNAGLLKKIYFPRLLIPVASLLTNLVLWIGALAIYTGLFPFMGGHFTAAQLAYPFYLVLYLVFLWGLSLILCTLYVDFRDLKHLVEVGIQVLFWATPIVYPLSRVPHKLYDVMMLSPMTEIIQIIHDLFYKGHLPSLRLTGMFVAWTIIVTAVGLWIFNRRAGELIERL